MLVAGATVGVAAVHHLIDPLVQQGGGLVVGHAAGDGGHHPLRVVFGGKAAGDDGAVRAARYHHVLAAAGAAAGGGGFLADAVAGVHLTEMIQVVASIGGGALVVVTVLAVHFQVGFYPTFNIRIGVGGVAAVAGHVPVRQSLNVGGHAIADLQFRGAAEDAHIGPVLKLVDTREASLAGVAHEGGFRFVGTVQVARLGTDRGAAASLVVVAVAGDALVGVGYGVAVGAASEQGT